jgi:hypothetical protein
MPSCIRWLRRAAPESCRWEERTPAYETDEPGAMPARGIRQECSGLRRTGAYPPTLNPSGRYRYLVTADLGWTASSQAREAPHRRDSSRWGDVPPGPASSLSTQVRPSVSRSMASSVMAPRKKRGLAASSLPRHHDVASATRARERSSLWWWQTRRCTRHR